ncbi:MAG TPA: class I SAM-dependent methyltransferase [Ktedonobacterales bacterium]|jgi:ubiquinone/menaquinone biosynthesis C-methylase UbiE|nr:class I SAM-dependent methyltransferase [Ktedonobacterales bacterium]
MSAPDPANTDTYALGRSGAETQRLIRQGQIYNPFTRRFLVEAGITAGMKVLDIGSGAGDVALIVADLVGPRGTVVGVDENAAILDVARARVQAAGWTNVTFLAGKVSELSLATDFDAVIGRWVLMYIAEPASVLRSLLDYLRPGGIVAFQEMDAVHSLLSLPLSPLIDKVRQWSVPDPEHLPPGAPNPQMGLVLYRTFLDAGLLTPQVRLDAPIGGGANWPGYEYLADTMRSLLPFLERMGVAPAADSGNGWGDINTLAERLRDEAVGQQGVQILPFLIGAWARKPA